MNKQEVKQYRTAGIVLGILILGACASEPQSGTDAGTDLMPRENAIAPGTIGFNSDRYTGRATQGWRAFGTGGVDADGRPRNGLLHEDDVANTESYDSILENPFFLAMQSPLSTFSIDVDTASYSNVRRFLNGDQLPPADAVRTEELVNYFPYDYAGPEDDAPFAVHAEVGGCPWAPQHRLVRIGLKGQEIAAADRPASNLVFLLDVSGSMNSANKLPLLQKSLGMLVQNLDERDRVAIVVYAGASGLVLPSTSCDSAEAIMQAVERLSAGGSTNGGAGIELAYKVAAENFIDGGINRVILATDGDFNVGTTDEGSLVRMIEKKASNHIFLTVLGFGMGNYQDSTLEKLADKGNGNYAYIDTQFEARKVLVEQMGATLDTIAKDVKIQVEFNPLQVAGYRLLGYENRMLAAQDFNDDQKDAGEIGAGHTVTALYEIVPTGVDVEVPGIEDLRYQTARQPATAAFTDEILHLKLRWKAPTSDTSKLKTVPVRDSGKNFFESSKDTRFAAAVAAFSLVLRDSKYRGAISLADVRTWAIESSGDDTGGYRAQFIQLVDKARELSASGS
jgi:Ca-activated chloride channel homolog